MNKFESLIRRVNLNYQHSKMIEYFIKNKIYSYKIVEANSDYYEKSLLQRMNILGAHSVDVLCKTIILENTAFDEKFASDYYKKYYVTIVQYTNEFNGEKIAKFLKGIQNTKCENKLSKKFFHFRLAEKELAFDMTGYRFNCITPFLMKCEGYFFIIFFFILLYIVLLSLA
jgi:hypothetical protein